MTSKVIPMDTQVLNNHPNIVQERHLSKIREFSSDRMQDKNLDALYLYYKELPQEEKTFEVSRRALMEDHRCLVDIPKEQICDRLLMDTVHSSKELWNTLDRSVKTKNVEYAFVLGEALREHATREAKEWGNFHNLDFWKGYKRLEPCEYIPTAYRTDEFYDFISQHFPANVNYIPTESRSMERMILAAGKDMDAFAYTPEKELQDVVLGVLQNAENVKDGFKRLFNACEHNIMFPDMLSKAVLFVAGITDNNNPDLSYRDALNQAIEKDPYFLLNIPYKEYVPISVLENLLECDVEDLKKNMEFIPLYEGDPMLLRAFHKFGSSLEHSFEDTWNYLSPQSHQYPESVINMVLHYNPEVFKLLPEELQTHERMVNAAVLKPEFLQEIPPHLQAQKVCLDVLGLTNVAISYFPKNLLKEEFLCQQMDKNPQLFKYLDDADKTRKVCELVTGKDVTTCAYLPVGHADLAIKTLNQMAGSDAKTVEHVFGKNNFRDREFASAFIEKFPELFPYVPNFVKQDPEHALKAVQLRGMNLQSIPEDFISPEIALKAVLKDKYAVSFVPDKIRFDQNLFSMAMHLKRCTGEYLPFDDTKKIYEGSPLKVSVFKNEKGTLEHNVVIKWNQKDHAFKKDVGLNLLDKLLPKRAHTCKEPVRHTF